MSNSVPSAVLDRPLTAAEEANDRISVLSDHLAQLTGLVNMSADRLFGPRLEKEGSDPRVAPAPPSGDIHRINFGLNGLSNQIDELRAAINRLEQ